MILDRSAREFYALEISTTPDAAAWEASFDDGATWVPSTTVGTDGYFRWLRSHGPDVPPVKVRPCLAASVVPIVRAIDSPEIIPRPGPGIYLT